MALAFVNFQSARVARQIHRDFSMYRSTRGRALQHSSHPATHLILTRRFRLCPIAAPPCRAPVEEEGKRASTFFEASRTQRRQAVYAAATPHTRPADSRQSQQRLQRGASIGVLGLVRTGRLAERQREHLSTSEGVAARSGLAGFGCRDHLELKCLCRTVHVLHHPYYAQSSNHSQNQ
eukprot:6175849-Pleurochrysis_carterae.AAC.2